MGRVLTEPDPAWRKVGVLGGAFDPLHNGHLALARGSLSCLGLDAVLFVPAARPPHKQATVASFHERLAMVAAVAASSPEFFVSDLEHLRSGPSYTVESLRFLKKHGGDGLALSFLVGYDAFLDLPMWKEYEAIPRLAEVVVAGRAGVAFAPAVDMARAFPGYRQVEHNCWRGEGGGRISFIELVLPDLSSTRVRQVAAAGGDLSAMLPPEVLALLSRRNLYSAG